MTTTRRSATRLGIIGLSTVGLATAGILTAAPASADTGNPTQFHVSWFRELSAPRAATTSATITVPTVSCAATGTPLTIQSGLTGSKVEDPANAIGLIRATCTGTTVAYTAEPQLDYRRAGNGTLTLAAGDRVRIDTRQDTQGVAVSVTAVRTGQTVSASGGGLSINGATLSGRPTQTATFGTITVTGATLNGAAFGNPTPTRWTQVDGAGRIIAETTPFTSNGTATTIVDRG